MKVGCVEWCRREMMFFIGNWFCISVILGWIMKCVYWFVVVIVVVILW